MIPTAIATGKAPPHDINVVIEIPQGSQVKYELDKDSGAVVVDRFLFTPMAYPAAYGFVPGTLSEDGDPTDVLVLLPAPVVPGCVVRCRPIGVLLMVSSHGHCLNDLLFRMKTGQLPIEIPAVVSNHPDFALLTASYGIPFYHLPVTAGDKAQQERQVLQIVERERIDLVVLARYMQILSGDMCQALSGRAINIHHSFLPSFKGALPYYQAHERGVKLIGATAHYVTSDLDEGPIIEQDIARVDHTMTPETLTQIGRDVESQVLARAVRWHVEHRILLNAHKTIVFR